ncbi:unnamed protein product [Closterium sp. Naga37s-1]|nr:unnamed protein product [Closterium sp. Naga37s-1]
MSLNAHSLSSLVSDPYSPGVGTAPPVAALPARLDHSHELSAAALRCAAVQAVIRVLAQHRPSLHSLLDHSDELSAAALLLLEWHSLKTHDLYCSLPHSPLPTSSPSSPPCYSSQAPHSVLLPYLRAKLHALFAARQRQRQARALFAYYLSTTPHTRYCTPGAAALPARQAACSVCCPPKAEAGPLFKSNQLHPIPSTTRQVLLPYLRTKLHSLFAARQRQRQARALWVGEDDGGDDGWGGTGEVEWGRGGDGGNNAGLGQGDGYGGAMGGEERSESGSNPGSMGSVGSLHGHEQLDDGLGTAGLRDETPGGEGVAGAAARVTDGRAEGGAGEEEVDVQGGQVVTGGATAGNSDARDNGGRRSSAIGSSRSSARGSRRWRQVLHVLRWVQRRAVRGAAAAYPWVQAPYEGVCLLYQLLYVMDAMPHYSPLSVSAVPAALRDGRHAALLARAAPPLPLAAPSHYTGAGEAACTLTSPQELTHRPSPPTELAEASSSISTRRQREFERLPGSPAIKAVQAALLKALYFTMDYAQTSVIAVVFAFKMAEWWYQTGEQKLSAPTVYPPPPPPPPPKASIPVPADRSLCPLCLCRRTNPTAPATSGFIFCYPCIFAYVDKFGRCPITHHPTTVDQLRRHFPDA